MCWSAKEHAQAIALKRTKIGPDEVIDFDAAPNTNTATDYKAHSETNLD